MLSENKIKIRKVAGKIEQKTTTNKAISTAIDVPTDYEIRSQGKRTHALSVLWAPSVLYRGTVCMFKGSLSLPRASLVAVSMHPASTLSYWLQPYNGGEGLLFNQMQQGPPNSFELSFLLLFRTRPLPSREFFIPIRMDHIRYGI